MKSIKEQIDQSKLNTNIEEMEMHEQGSMLNVDAKNLPAYYPYIQSS